MTAQVVPKAARMETLEPCSSQPEKATRMKRARQAPKEAPPEDARGPGGMDRRQLCEEMIQSGFVQSFVDFFYLTHRPDPLALEQRLSNKGPDEQEETADDVADVEVPEAEMTFLRDNLTRAETAQRKGETATVYQSFSRLAEYFQQRTNDQKTGVYFCEKCLEIARLTGDFRGEMMANHNLGLAHSLIGDVEGATRYHERHLDMARGIEDHAEVLVALRELVAA